MAQIAEFDKLMTAVAAGSEEAVWQLAETYTPHIVRVARRTLSPKLRQKIDSLDIAQTLWSSLLLQPKGILRLRTPNDLINYLMAAARKKVLEKAHKFGGQKYDITREVSMDSRASVTPHVTHADNLLSNEPTPSAAVSAGERWHHILSKVSSQDREIVRLRLEGRTFVEIGTQLQIDERTARRAVDRLISRFAD